MHDSLVKLENLIGTLPFHVAARDLIYPAFVLVLYGVWIAYMDATEHWFCLSEYWEMPLTMSVGSLVAGSTPTGGAAVAFPVFTKVLGIAPDQARTFGLMIQSIGMTSASLYIWHRGMSVLWDVVLYASLGGVLGALISVGFVELPDSYPRLLFTTMVSLFAISLVFSKVRNRHEVNLGIAHFGVMQRIEFLLLGFAGGLVADATGSGIDIIVFMALALSYRICERISIPTTVICMAINSIVGFALHQSVVHDTGAVWNYWLASIPVVAVGAPLGAFLVTRCSPNKLVGFIVALIAIDLVTTILVVDLAPEILSNLAVAASACVCVFAWMIRRGNHRLSNPG